MYPKIYTIAFFLFTQLSCRAQAFSARDLYGRWRGARFDVNAYYDFISDSTYKYWTSNEWDSSRIYHIEDLDTNYFHVMDENHFFALATFYATEKIIFTREPPKIQINSNLDTTRKVYKVDSVNVYFNFHLDDFLSCMTKEHFQVYKNKKAIPAFIEEQLDSLTGGFSLGNPEEKYQCCCTSDRTLPKRKLEFLSMSKNMLAMTYLTGGVGEEEHILLIKFEDKRIVDMWYGVDLQSLHSIKGIYSYLSKTKANPQDLHVNFDL